MNATATNPENFVKIAHNMPSAEYHAHPAVSKSLLDKISKSPLHARAYLDGAREEPTAAMAFGTALHTAVLEAERFDTEYKVFEGDRRTKAGKEAYEALLATGASIISAADYDAITAMTMAIRQHKVAGSLLMDGHAESSVFWQHPGTRLECKARPDWWRNDGIVVDLKTTDDASPAAFARSVATYRYHVQAAHYMIGTQAKRFVFIAVEKKAPHAVAVYELDADTLRMGHTLRERDLDQYASCVEFNTWPGYPAEIQTLALPKWATTGSEE
jgi:exodeoxyribonuclease VIII